MPDTCGNGPRLATWTFVTFVLLLCALYIPGASADAASPLIDVDDVSRLEKSLQPRAGPARPQGAGDASMGGTEEGSGEESDPDEPINFGDFCRKGALATIYLTTPDEDILRDLAIKKSAEWARRPQLESFFDSTDDFRLYGWAAEDITQDLREDLNGWVPFCDALRDLILSYAPRPFGQLELYAYRHILPWESDGEECEVSTQPQAPKHQVHFPANNCYSRLAAPPSLILSRTLCRVS